MSATAAKDEARAWFGPKRRPPALIQVLLAAISFCISSAAFAASPDKSNAGDLFETPDQVFALVTRQSIGAPLRAEIGDQATERLSEDLTFVPREPAARLVRSVRPDRRVRFRGTSVRFGRHGRGWHRPFCAVGVH